MTIEVASFATASVSFLILAFVLLAGRGRQLQKTVLGIATLATGLWSGVVAYQAAFGGLLSLTQSLELLRAFAWFAFLLLVLHTAEHESEQASKRFRRTFVGIAAFTVGLTLLAVYRIWGGSALESIAGNDVLAGHLLIAVGGLTLVEQLYRNSSADQRRSLKYLCLAVGGMFGYDFYMYSEALLTQRIDAGLWDARGFVHAIVAAVIALALQRGLRWSLSRGTVDIALSHRMVFHSTALLAAGVYLLLMGTGGYLVRVYGGSWGPVAQIIFLFGTAVMLGILFFSEHMRSNLKVLIAKHFFYYKYDYRDEWLRFIRTLSSSGETTSLRQRVIRAIAQIVESGGGALWLIHDDYYVPVATWNVEDEGEAAEPVDGDLARFLRARGWIVDRQEWEDHPEVYGGMSMPQWMRREPDAAWLVVPLIYRESLMGFVVLRAPVANVTLNWEDRDLLKTVANQAASYLAEEEAAEALSEARQFEAFNRVAAFVVHDLKNSISQLSMLVRNAERHKHNPEFIDDAVQTIDETVKRMNCLMAQLRGSSGSSAAAPVDLVEAVERAVETRGTATPYPVLETDQASLRITADPDRLRAVVCHLIENAQEATSAEGQVTVRLERHSAGVTLDVVDTGSGMDASFVRERLFKPFCSTKGGSGMGIGAFEAREFARGLGGDVEVTSQPGQGTTFRLYLPASVVIDSEPKARLAVVN